MDVTENMDITLPQNINPEAGKFFDGFNSKKMQLYEAEVELRGILSHIGKDIKVVPPFVCINGSRTFLGDGVHINLETFFNDTREIHLGNRVLTGPFLKILTSSPDTPPAEVNIEDDVWIGGGVTIYPGVRIGRGAVISAGSIVTQDVAENALVVGSPARQIKVVDQTQIPEGINSDTTDSERQKMVSQRVFYSSDPELKVDKQKAYEFFRDLNQSQLSPAEKREQLKGIFGAVGENIDVNKIYFSYGYQIFIGDGVTLGNRVFLGDAGKITIGDNAILEPEVQLYTTNHCLPIPYRGYISAEDITISHNARIGKGSIILPGVTVGEGAIVEANSVVNHDVPPFTTVSGIPAKAK